MKLIGSSRAVHTPEFHKRKVWQTRLKVSAIVLLVLVVLVGPVLLLRNSHLLIAGVNIAGNSVTTSEDIERVVSEDLSGNYLWVIPKSSAAFYPKGKIEADLLALTPRLRSVTVSLAGTRSLKVSVTERQPHALYCAAAGQGKCYFIDETGYIFSEAPDFSGDVYTVYATEPDLTEPLRTQLFGPAEFKKLEAFLKDISALHINPQIITRSGGDFTLMQKSGPVVKWREAEDFDAIAVNLESFINNSSLKPADIARMTYIDLSFENKVFYKFQGE